MKFGYAVVIVRPVSIAVVCCMQQLSTNMDDVAARVVGSDEAPKSILSGGYDSDGEVST